MVFAALERPNRRKCLGTGHTRNCACTQTGAHLHLEKAAQVSSVPGFSRAGDCRCCRFFAFASAEPALVSASVAKRKSCPPNPLSRFLYDSPHTCSCNPWGRHSLSTHFSETSAVGQNSGVGILRESPASVSGGQPRDYCPAGNVLLWHRSRL